MDRRTFLKAAWGAPVAAALMPASPAAAKDTGESDVDVITWKRGTPNLDRGSLWNWSRIEFEDMRPGDVVAFADPVSGPQGVYVIETVPEPYTLPNGKRTWSVKVRLAKRGD